MSKYIEDIKFYTFFGIAFWMMVSLMASSGKAGADNCGIDYPIDYVIHTNLFCPIKESTND